MTGRGAERENYAETFNSRTVDLLLGKQDEKPIAHKTTINFTKWALSWLF